VAIKRGAKLSSSLLGELQNIAVLVGLFQAQPLWAMSTKGRFATMASDQNADIQVYQAAQPTTAE